MTMLFLFNMIIDKRDRIDISVINADGKKAYNIIKNGYVSIPPIYFIRHIHYLICIIILY